MKKMSNQKLRIGDRVIRSFLGNPDWEDHEGTIIDYLKDIDTYVVEIDSVGKTVPFKTAWSQSHTLKFISHHLRLVD